MLEIKNLHVSVDQKQLVHGVTLTVRPGEVHALMGPNGSGKSSLAAALMGHPSYAITSGKVVLSGEDITMLAPEKRAGSGLFLAFQYPQSIPGLSVQQFLQAAVNAQAESRGKKPLSAKEFGVLLEAAATALQLDKAFLERGVNDGFSGGEKKRLEVLQLSVLKPHFAVLDETDSGLDVDALKLVAEGVNREVAERNMGVLVITHYQRLLHYLKPTHVHVMAEGKVVASGGPELVERVEATGYQTFLHHA